MRYFFEEYAFDTDRRELHRVTSPVLITPQVFDLLDYLIRHRDRVVSKDDLLRRWRDREPDYGLVEDQRCVRDRLQHGTLPQEQRLRLMADRKGAER